jgi:hypothetical protein
MNPSPKVPAGHGGDTPGDLALAEYMLRVDRGEDVDRRAFLAAHPEAAAELLAYFSGSTSLDRLVDSISMPFGPELAPALEPIRELAAGQAALVEDSVDIGQEPTAVILVESGVNQAAPPTIAAPAPAAAGNGSVWLKGWLWGAGAVLGTAVLLAIFWRPPSAAHDDYEEPPPRPFVAADVEWAPAGPVVTLFDEEDRFANVTPAEALQVVSEQPFAGQRAICVTRPAQCAALPGLPARIREFPMAGEYRYLRFAWKKPGTGPIAFVLWGQAPNRKFHYFAGKRIGPKETVKSISLDKPPREWAVVERDLFADFGQLNVSALTLVTPPGEAAFFDAIELSSKPWGATRAPKEPVAVTNIAPPNERPKHKQDARKGEKAASETKAFDGAKAR